MKKFILIFKSKKTGKTISLPVYAEEQTDAQLMGELIAKTSEDFYGTKSIKLESAKEVTAES